jgi:hypothetical protein
MLSGEARGYPPGGTSGLRHIVVKLTYARAGATGAQEPCEVLPRRGCPRRWEATWLEATWLEAPGC